MDKKCTDMREKCINFGESGLKHVKGVALKQDRKMNIIFMYNVNCIEDFATAKNFSFSYRKHKTKGKKMISINIIHILFILNYNYLYVCISVLY